MFSAMTSLIPAHISAKGDCSRDEPLPRRFPLTDATNPPRLTAPRVMGNSSPHFKPKYGKSPRVTLAVNLQSPRVRESSGVVVSRAHRGVLWTHNDSGDGPYVYATDLSGADRGAVRIRDARAVDWEDIALGPCPAAGGACLYIADTGDNEENRKSVVIYA